MKKIATICVLATPMLLAAQEVQQDSIKNLDEFVVSAVRINRPAAVSKINAPVREVPITVNRISAKEIQAKGYNDAVEALRGVPGVNPIRQYGAFHMFRIRGFYESILIDNGMRDERQALWQSAPITGLGSVERIEVLKGAASMQQGHSAVGGVVNIVRKQVSPDFGAYAKISVGSYNSYRFNAGLNGAVTDKLLMRADVEANHSDGWRANYAKGYNFSVVAKWLINSKSNLQLSVYNNKDNYGGDYGTLRTYNRDIFEVSSDRKIYSAGDAYWTKLDRKTVHGFSQDDLAHKNIAAQLKYEYHFNRNWSLSEQLFVSSDDVKYMSTDAYDIYGEENAAPGLLYYYKNGDKKVYTDLTKLSRGGFAFDYETRGIQNQTELSGKVITGSLKHNLLFGYNYFLMNSDRYDAADLTGTGYTNPVTYVNPIRNQGPLGIHFNRKQTFDDRTHGLYAQDYIKWGRFSVLAGLRLDHFTRDFSVYKTNNKTVVSDNGTQRIQNLALTYRAGLVYDITKSINIYAATSNFYKPQVVSLSSEVAYLDNDGKEMGASELSKLPPTQGNQFEVGTHILLAKKFSLNASAYYLDLNNKLNSYLGTREDGKRIGALVDGYQSKGFELDLNYRPTSGLGFQLGYSYTDARVKAGKGANAKYTTNAGNLMAQNPQHQLSAWVFGSRKLTKKSSLNAGLGTEMVSKSYTSDNNDITIPGYAIFNGMLSYEWSKLTFQLNLNNILDKDYTRHILYDYQYLPSEGRNFTLSLLYKL